MDDNLNSTNNGFNQSPTINQDQTENSYNSNNNGYPGKKLSLYLLPLQTVLKSLRLIFLILKLSLLYFLFLFQYKMLMSKCERIITQLLQ
ncbi:hypothetical protein RCL_jg11679.t1 [Rhizophagus clarus]|uniref:Uncharacterized protein n=1 Tax=Rhizophagus clarus TaxID=94130 RepID=A0A8H3M8M8_9GLOM|nr:hypothetical protein RCL_jg11679.t1 [Rhizophagus clarus]